MSKRESVRNYILTTYFSSRKYLVMRLLAAFLVAYIGKEVGIGYLHFCLSGNKFLEGLAIAGTPILSFMFVLAIPRLKYSIPIGLMCIMVVYFLRQPYLDWVHGPNSPWPGRVVGTESEDK